MSLLKQKPTLLKILRDSLFVIVGAVLIWRGIWVILDLLDDRFFEGNHLLSSIIGIIIGVVCVYLADRDLGDIV